MSLQVLRCLFVFLLLLSLKGFGDALRVGEKKNDENSTGKRSIFNSLPAEQSLNSLKSVGAIQNFAFLRKIPFPSRKPESKLVVDRLTNKVASQNNKENESQGTPHVVGSIGNLVSWLGMNIQMIFRHLMQPVVEKYFALTEKLLIQSRLSLVKNETNNVQFKSNKLSRDSAKNQVNTTGKVLKTKISDLVDITNEFKSGQRIGAAFSFPGLTTKQRNRRSPYLAKDIYMPRQSSELVSNEPNEPMLKSLKSSSILATSGDHHVEDLFLDKDFMRDVSYFVNHPDKMLSPDSPGIVGIGKLRPTKPPSSTTSTTTRSIVEAVGNQALVLDRSRYIEGSSSQEETKIIHEHTKTVESHKSKIKTNKNHEQAENSIDISVGSQHTHTFPYNKQLKMGKQDVTQRLLLLTSSSQTPVASDLQPVAQVNDNYANKLTFSTGAYSQSHINTTPRTANELYRTTPGPYHEEYTVSVSEKPLHPQQSTSDPMGVVPEDPHNYRTISEYNPNPFSSHNSIDGSNVFYGNDQSKAPYSWLQQRLDNLKMHLFSKGGMTSGNLKELGQEKTYRPHSVFSNVPTIIRARRTFHKEYDIANTYGPQAEKFWNPLSFYRAFNSPVYNYGNWMNGRIPVVSAF